MQTEVLRVLRAEARSWWRHRELRRTGDLDAARRLEHQTISRNIGYLRAAINNPNAYVSCGGGGTILHLGLTTISLYAPVERFPLASLATLELNASYLYHWLRVLRSDKTAIFKHAADAQKACDYLIARSEAGRAAATDQAA